MDQSLNIADIRKEYTLDALDVYSTAPSPFVQFNTWFGEALKSDVLEPNAMVLSTVHQSKPSSRVVLLKGLENNLFIFYTNYMSAKGKHLAENPHANLLFFWPELERQIRIEGTVSKVDESISDLYFQSRPFESKLGAHASPQSQEIQDRTLLEIHMQELRSKYEGKEVPRPTHWGGYGLNPVYFEFWQGRASRLHDRIVYTLDINQTWNKSRLAP